jgi:hypothetical protein
MSEHRAPNILRLSEGIVMMFVTACALAAVVLSLVAVLAFTRPLDCNPSTRPSPLPTSRVAVPSPSQLERPVP